MRGSPGGFTPARVVRAAQSVGFFPVNRIIGAIFLWTLETVPYCPSIPHERAVLGAKRATALDGGGAGWSSGNGISD
ncbi:MAG: hypothetical protein E6J34_00770 [Chloroflexi bacterium]|nr:MAG: hypothetical protein E6J34_00770 [Chloroflexota bacterium]